MGTGRGDVMTPGSSIFIINAIHSARCVAGDNCATAGQAARQVREETSSRES